VPLGSAWASGQERSSGIVLGMDPEELIKGYHEPIRSQLRPSAGVAAGLLGLPVAQAEPKANAAGFELTQVRRLANGEWPAITADLKVGRIPAGTTMTAQSPASSLDSA
jgi:hypothetical protein